MAKTVVGMMDNMRQAQEVVQELTSSGFDRNSINLIGSEKAEGATRGIERDETKERTKGAVTGAGAGAAVGGLAGFVAGLTAISIPGIGPVLALGPLGAALAGAGAGAVAGGAIGALTKMGVPEDDARYYSEGIKRGGVLVAVTTDDALAERAAAIMQKHGAIDIDKRAEGWRKEGWTGFGERETARTTGRTEELTPQARQGMKSPQSEGVLPVVEEEVRVGKREVPLGVVRVYSTVTTQPVEEQVHLREEHASVERHPVDRPASAAEGDAFKEASFEIRESKEEPVVSKEARVKEEVIVGKEATERVETIHETARRTNVEVEKGGEIRQHGMGATGLAGEDEEFRRHYQATYGGKGDFDSYRSAYHYADEDSEARRFQGRDFSEIEEDLHQSWDKSHPGTWAQFKDAIRYGWNKKRHH